MLVVVSLGGWSLWKWGRPTLETGRPGEFRWAAVGARDGEPAAGDEEGAVDAELGWDEDLGKEGYLLWRPKLALQGPWTDAARALTGGVKLLEELPHGLCHPRVQELLVELFTDESHMVKATARVIADNPAKALEVLLPRFKSAYFKTLEIDLYAPRDEKKGGKSGASRRAPPLEGAEAGGYRRGETGQG
ncbi:hypothetical protein DAT35_08715 [Vitiosangium sp. GDMCC 1.1324]|nr:hypothetical protein DAT35_08715 [Vitiosangium sp. GDMCC 1.1324]